jgi:hypothetical protein
VMEAPMAFRRLIPKNVNLNLGEKVPSLYLSNLYPHPDEFTLYIFCG